MACCHSKSTESNKLNKLACSSLVDVQKALTENSHNTDTEIHPALLKLSGITEITVRLPITNI